MCCISFIGSAKNPKCETNNYSARSSNVLESTLVSWNKAPDQDIISQSDETKNGCFFISFFVLQETLNQLLNSLR